MEPRWATASACWEVQRTFDTLHLAMPSSNNDRALGGLGLIADASILGYGRHKKMGSVEMLMKGSV